MEQGLKQRELSARQALAVTNTYFSQSQIPLNFNFVGYEAYNDYQKNSMEHNLHILVNIYQINHQLTIRYPKISTRILLYC